MLTAIVLGAGYGTRLENDLLEDTSGQFAHLVGLPKPLLPVAGKPLVDHWLEAFRALPHLFGRVLIVSSAAKYGYFQEWLEERPGHFAAADLLNDGSWSNDERLGAVADIQFALDEGGVGPDSDVCVVAGDTLFDPRTFNLEAICREFLEVAPDGDRLLCYPVRSEDEVRQRGIIEMDPGTGLVRAFLEKPSPQQTASRLACPAFYLLRRTTLPRIRAFLQAHQHAPLEHRDAPGRLVQWLVQQGDRFYASVIGARYDIGSLAEYRATLAAFEAGTSRGPGAGRPLPVRAREVLGRAWARAGLLGNPSDGYGGRTLAVTLANYGAEVRVRDTGDGRVVLQPHPMFDPCAFGSLAALGRRCTLDGFDGGLRLVRAGCAKFAELARAAGVDTRRGFQLWYNTTIPVQVGLAGSSAILVALFRALAAFYDVPLTRLCPLPVLPHHVLAIERDMLGIGAGPQDRVVQVYEGLVSMDFDAALLREHGHGAYHHVPATRLPPLYLAFLSERKCSGRVHSPLRARYDRGEPEVVQAMREFAELARRGAELLQCGEGPLSTAAAYELSQLMARNFALRRAILGDAVIGAANLQMVQLAEQHGLVAKFCGSGGAVVCMRPDGSALGDEAPVRAAFAREGFRFVRVRVRTPDDPIPNTVIVHS